MYQILSSHLAHKQQFLNYFCIKIFSLDTESCSWYQLNLWKIFKLLIFMHFKWMAAYVSRMFWMKEQDHYRTPRKQLMPNAGKTNIYFEKAKLLLVQQKNNSDFVLTVHPLLCDKHLHTLQKCYCLTFFICFAGANSFSLFCSSLLRRRFILHQLKNNNRAEARG